ncbi:hypothetical protein Y1Q_0011968 [Alligator mississippiensis]|uniref:Uncharacterized protein n=1 Tax=Alligator mississippiensis TaxID=8496 RepID=A0A151NH36_ALLMI|nr:hypothetical protein Y1Q_0011968 [Alligator mississippiensis]
MYVKLCSAPEAAHPVYFLGRSGSEFENAGVFVTIAVPADEEKGQPPVGYGWAMGQDAEDNLASVALHAETDDTADCMTTQKQLLLSPLRVAQH